MKMLGVRIPWDIPKEEAKEYALRHISDYGYHAELNDMSVQETDDHSRPLEVFIHYFTRRK